MKAKEKLLLLLITTLTACTSANQHRVHTYIGNYTEYGLIVHELTTQKYEESNNPTYCIPYTALRTINSPFSSTFREREGRERERHHGFRNAKNEREKN